MGGLNITCWSLNLIFVSVKSPNIFIDGYQELLHIYAIYNVLGELGNFRTYKSKYKINPSDSFGQQLWLFQSLWIEHVQPFSSLSKS